MISRKSCQRELRLPQERTGHKGHHCLLGRRQHSVPDDWGGSPNWVCPLQGILQTPGLMYSVANKDHCCLVTTQRRPQGSCFNELADRMSLNYLQIPLPHLLNEYPNSHTRSIQNSIQLSPSFNFFF